VKNILATDRLRLSFRPSPTALVLAISMTASTAWGVWATDKLLELERREVVTVQLARIMGDFVEAEARSGRPPEETRERVQAYLKAVDASVRKLGREGRTVMVAEAVVAGSAPDLTEVVRADVGRRMRGTANVQQ
jgi:hypothetical protein